VPQFVVDVPGGGGKTVVNPDYVLSRDERTVILRNYEGVIARYVEPEDTRFGGCPPQCRICEERKERGLDQPQVGLECLLSGDKVSLELAHLDRHERSAHD
jgi:lysine 2,3-aminomutase